jgi:hypothetical protein
MRRSGSASSMVSTRAPFHVRIVSRIVRGQLGQEFGLVRPDQGSRCVRQAAGSPQFALAGRLDLYPFGCELIE